MSSKAPRDIATEFAFRPPQRHALMRLHANLTSIDLTETISDIEASLPGRISFDTDFPSFCFDMATGVGKTKLLAGCIVYLARNMVSRSFFIIAPGETIYSKLVREFTPGDPSYLFRGIAGMESPRVVTGDDYLYRESVEASGEQVTIYVFNIQKLLKGTTKQRYKFHSFQETLGSSFADRVREKGDLVVLMDESHRYRGPEYFTAINALHPLLGLEFTATPIFRRNVIFEYPIKRAIAEGWVKRLRPIYRQNDAAFDEELDELKLRDGLKVHESTKVELDVYADSVGLNRIRPLVLINLELIERAKELKERLEGKEFGYKGRVLLIHSRSEDEEERQLVDLEKSGDIEIVVHVNKLREGWDVKNIFTIIPLRASISTILTAQTIGRGVRLPFGANNREELASPDIATLNVICYQRGRDNYARIIEASDQLGEVEPEDADRLKESERITVGLVEGFKSRIRVPEVTAVVKTSAAFSPFIPAVMISDEETAARLVGVDIAGDDTEDLGEATATALVNQASHLASSLIERIPELKQSDLTSVIGITKKYLAAATGSTDRAEWESYLESKRRFAREDLTFQIRDHIKKASSVTYKVGSSHLAFEPFDTVMPVGSTTRDHKAVPNDEVRASLVGQYKKTTYGGFRFDSQQEKWLADALDADKSILEWFKVPEGKLVIRTPAGSYYPDFLALANDGMYLLEVKDSKRVEEKNRAVVEKARRAAQWCQELSKAGKTPWRYRLLRHDRVKQGDTLEGILAGAVSLDDFIS